MKITKYNFYGTCWTFLIVSFIAIFFFAISWTQIILWSEIKYLLVSFVFIIVGFIFGDNVLSPKKQEETKIKE